MTPDNREPFGVAVRERTQQKSVDNAENRRVRSDAERESEHGHGGEAGFFSNWRTANLRSFMG